MNSTKVLTTLLTILLFFSNNSFSQNATQINLILLAGQSNMAGAGNYDELSKIDKARLENASKTVFLSNKGQLTPLNHYVSTVKAKKYGFKNFFGPEVFAGIYLAEKYPQQTFVLIKQAVGGTSLYGAWNANWNQDAVKQIQKNKQKHSLRLFEQHIKQIQSQLDDFHSKKQKYKLAGLLWMQGETDTRLEISAQNYQNNLEVLIARYRNVLNTPDLPVVVGEINMLRSQFKQGVHLIRAAMKHIATTDPNVKILTTSLDPSWQDYPKHADNTHYNTIGQKRLGWRFAEILDEQVVF